MFRSGAMRGIIMKTYFLVLLAFLYLSTSGAFASEEFDTEYVELRDPKRTFFFTDTSDDGKKIAYLNHTGSEYMECPNEPEYKCFLSNIFSLVVHLDLTKEKWDYHDLPFQREFLGDISLLGRDFKAVQKIQSSQHGMDLNFYISAKDGLFMFTVLDNASGTQRGYLSKLKCGIDILEECQSQ